jgi:putative cardiolipin synthase
MAQVATTLSKSAHDPAALKYTSAIHDSPFVQAMVERRLPFEWAATRMISDDPAKGLGRAEREELFPFQLREAIGEPKTHLELVAAYFVPTSSGAVSFVGMAKQGVKIRVLTNSLEALDAPYVHAGYAKRRKALLEAGVTLYEMKRLSPETRETEKARQLSKFRFQPARENIRRGWRARFHRFVQLRSAFAKPEHGAWICDRESCPGGDNRNSIRE